MIYMEHITKQKFYLLLVDCDMFDTWYVRCVSGGIGANSRVRSVQQLYSSKDEAWQELTNIEYLKRQNGYRYVDFEDIPERIVKRLTQENQQLPQLTINNKEIIPNLINEGSSKISTQLTPDTNQQELPF